MEKNKALLVFMALWLSMFLTVSAQAVSDCESIGVSHEDMAQASSETVLMAVLTSPIQQVKSCFGQNYQKVIESQSDLSLLFKLAGIEADFQGLPSEFVKDVVDHSTKLSDSEQRKIQSQILAYIVVRKDSELLLQLNQTGYFSTDRFFSDDPNSRSLICRSYFSGMHPQDDQDFEAELLFWKKAIQLGVSEETRCGDWTLKSKIESLSEDMGIDLSEVDENLKSERIFDIDKIFAKGNSGSVMVGEIQYQFQLTHAGQCSDGAQKAFFKQSLSFLNAFEMKQSLDRFTETCQMNLTFTQKSKNNAKY